jgi:hypothetical protein
MQCVKIRPRLAKRIDRKWIEGYLSELTNWIGCEKAANGGVRGAKLDSTREGTGVEGVVPRGAQKEQK